MKYFKTIIVFLLLSMIHVTFSSSDKNDLETALQFTSGVLNLESENFFVQFYHLNDDPNEKPVSAVIYSRQLAVHGIEFIPINSSNVYLFSLDKQNLYKNLLEENTYAVTALNKNACLSKPITQSQTLSSSTLENLQQKIIDSQNIIISFGAGLSAGYVPTLDEFYAKLGLVKQRFTCDATDESMQNFINELVTNKSNILETVHQQWDNIICKSTIETTPAHEALKDIQQKLISKYQKNVFVYTDNEDEIHNKVGIKLAKVQDNNYTVTAFPTTEQLNNHKSVIILCGQSIDFKNYISTILGKCNHHIDIYSLNLHPDNIVIFKNFDSKQFSDDFTKLTKAFLKMSYVQGSGHELLPQLAKLL